MASICTSFLRRSVCSLKLLHMSTAKRYVLHHDGLVQGLSITSSITNEALISLQKYNMKEADEILKKAEQILADSLTPNTAKPFDYYVARSLYYLKLNDMPNATELFNEARRHYPHMVGDGDFAYMLHENDKHEECIAYVHKKKLNDRADTNYYHWYMMSGAYGGLKQYEQALEMSDRALKVFEEYGDHDNEQGIKMKLVKQRGEILCALNEYERGLKYLEEEIKAFEEDTEIDGDRMPFLILKSFWLRAKAQWISDGGCKCDDDELQELKLTMKQIVDKISGEENKANREIMGYCIGAAKILDIDIYELILKDALS